MSLLLAVNDEKAGLLDVARTMVLICMHKAWDNCRQRRSKPQEPDFVASLVLKGAKILNNGWGSILARRDIRIGVTAIYCHQTPKIKFSGMKKSSCELGDLLWCHSHTDKHNNTTYNAILYQAKMSSKQPHKISVGELDQLTLYTTWPEFIYVSPVYLKNEERYIKPRAPRKGAQYLLIDDRPPEDPRSGIIGVPGTYPIGSCIAQRTILDHADLGFELVSSLALLSGDPFDEKGIALKEEGWSRVVWDLLDVSVKMAFKRSRSGYFKQPRAVGIPPSAMNGCYYITSMRDCRLISSLWGIEKADMETPPSNQDGEFFDEGGGGMSILLVETYELGE